jgi:hypothetical protein
MIVKPFNNAGGYTTFDNYILDYVMPNCKPNTWKVVCATLRKTKGWQKYSDVISFSQYMELTGIKNRTTMNDAIQDALNSGYIVRIPNGQSFSYALNRDLEIEIPEEPVQKSDQNQYGNRTTTSTETGHTKERIKERKKEEGASAAPTFELFGDDPQPTQQPKRKQAGSARPRDPLLSHPAITAYREVTRRQVPTAWRERVADTVGDSPQRVERWRRLLDDWCGSGWNAGNVKGMLERFNTAQPGRSNNGGAPRVTLSALGFRGPED